ncbi:MAG TPA: tetratricopeptide repeat protein [Thermoanaerobaculia bacterium]|nr:tetratricopeptide repeat protein [Thermoanaerobaculia bacterium]
MSFTVRQVSEMLGLSPSQIRSFASQGFLQPERGRRGELRFGFQDLVILRTAGELSSAHIPQRKVKRILERLRDQLPEGRSLTGMRIAADGDRVSVSDGGAMWNPESGQALFDFSVDELEEQTANIADVDELFQRACDLEPVDSQQARDAYERVLELDPDHVDAHVNLGRLLHEEKAPAAAEAHYRSALAVDADHETAAFNLGVALEDLGRLREAIAAYERALELDPHNADAHYNLAGIYERRGDKATALRHLKACRAAK